MLYCLCCFDSFCWFGLIWFGLVCCIRSVVVVCCCLLLFFLFLCVCFASLFVCVCCCCLFVARCFFWGAAASSGPRHRHGRRADGRHREGDPGSESPAGIKFKCICALCLPVWLLSPLSPPPLSPLSLFLSLSLACSSVMVLFA